MPNINFLHFIWILCIVQFYLALRYAVKAVTGHVDNYSFLKLVTVLFIPIVGYFIATKEETPIV
jgi:hypothetical protein